MRVVNYPSCAILDTLLLAPYRLASKTEIDKNVGYRLLSGHG